MSLSGFSYSIIQVTFCPSGSFKFYNLISYLLDPVGTKAPNLPLKDKLILSGSRVEEVLTLICHAQGFPVPSFRYLKMLFVIQN